MPEGWSDYGYPDHIAFRTVYLPYVGMLKAINERRAAVDFEPVAVPEYFSKISTVAVSEVGNLEYALSAACYEFVNPDKIQAGKSWRTYFWTLEELLESVVDSPADIVSFYPDARYKAFTPAWPVKWAIQRYNAVNKLRYVATVREDYPRFEYEDKYNTFNFKEVSA